MNDINSLNQSHVTKDINNLKMAKYIHGMAVSNEFKQY